ncbi:MAG: hypothetical protein MMC23_007859 [Stictis urceolatum]|nr:hypothetical protein [Stictis urceolata]
MGPNNAEDMVYDSNLPLLRICNGDRAKLIEDMCRAQRHTLSAEERQKSHEWAERLRFLDISVYLNVSGPQLKEGESKLDRNSEVSESSEGSSSERRCRSEGGDSRNDSSQGDGTGSEPNTVRTLPLTRRGDHKSESYVAVSYCWNSESRQQAGRTYHTQLVNSRREAKVKRNVLERAIGFASSHARKLLWIDQESIDQDDWSADKKVGIQSIDLVYERSHLPVAFLDVRLGTRETSSLDRLLSGNIFSGIVGRAKLRGSVSSALVKRILNVLQRILSDKWWSRTWTYQEDHCCRIRRMKLLIAYDGSSNGRFEFDFGPTKGELEVPIQVFRARVTHLKLACIKAGYTEDLSDLAKAREYRELNHTMGMSGLHKHSSMTSFVYADVDERENHLTGDRLAILANCCGFSERLDADKLADNGQGLSVCIPALFFLNGEIFHNAIAGTEKLGLTASELVQSIAFSTFEPPGKKCQTSFVNHCRFTNVELRPEGVLAAGWL